MYFAANAEGGTDAFFGNWNGESERNSLSGLPTMPKSGIGSPANDDVPLGNGLLIMTALGSAYGVKNLKDKKSRF